MKIYNTEWDECSTFEYQYYDGISFKYWIPHACQLNFITFNFQ